MISDYPPEDSSFFAPHTGSVLGKVWNTVLQGYVSNNIFYIKISFILSLKLSNDNGKVFNMNFFINLQCFHIKLPPRFSHLVGSNQMKTQVKNRVTSNVKHSMRNEIWNVCPMIVTYFGRMLLILLRINLMSSIGDKSDFIFFMSFKIATCGKCVMLWLTS